MTFFAKFILVSFLAIPVLAGCESFQKETRSVETSPVTITDRPAPNLSVPPSDGDLRMMNTKLSGGSVEVFSLDGAPPDMGVPIPAVSRDQNYGGLPMNNDPRVTVYPLDGVTPAYAAEPASSMTPTPYGMPSGPAWPNGNGGGGTVTREKLPSTAGSNVSSIYFPYGSSNLEGGDKSVLREAAETAKFAPVDRVVVEGYASQPTQTNDPVKAKILNLKESLKRATVVSEKLIESGVPAEKIKTVGWGDTKPSGGNEAAQRRVDIVTGAGR